MLDDHNEYPEFEPIGMTCPLCGVREQTQPTKVNIRGFKVFDEFGDWSECLVCESWFI